jgi:hypothetical protein
MASRGFEINDLITPSTPIKQRSNDLTRDQRIEIKALRKYANWTYEEISAKTGHSIRQVQRACDGPVTPQKCKGRQGKVKITTPQREKIRVWLFEDPIHRELPWNDLRYFLPPEFHSFGDYSIHTALRTLGYKRRVRRRKIILTDANKRIRVNFAKEQLQLRPRPEDWEGVIFSDETWATNNPMWKKWLTIHDTEDPDAFALIRRKPHGWMFWGQFAGARKGAGFFWEKEWGGISAHKYIFFVLPLVRCFFNSFPDISIYQQDNAPSHRAKITKAALGQMGIPILIWPANSPDLNPIENLWRFMKDWIESNYDIQSLTLPELRDAVLRAWEAIPNDMLLRLAHSMVKRLQKCIEKKGDVTGY